MNIEAEKQRFDLHIHNKESKEFISYGVGEVFYLGVSLKMHGVGAGDHNTSAAFKEAMLIEEEYHQRTGRSIPFFVYYVEITALEYSGFQPQTPHILVAFLDPRAKNVKKGLQKLPILRRVPYICQWADDMNALAFVAHPEKHGNMTSLSYGQVARFQEEAKNKGLATFDGFECADTRGIRAEAVQLARRLGFPLIGGSDGHARWEACRAGFEICSDKVIINSPLALRRCLEVTPELTKVYVDNIPHKTDDSGDFLTNAYAYLRHRVAGR